MQVRIGQFNYPRSEFHGKWYACLGKQFEAIYFRKKSCQFESCMTDDDYCTSAGFLAHLVKLSFPQATITIEPNAVES
jgi:hypothetical protein